MMKFRRKLSSQTRAHNCTEKNNRVEKWNTDPDYKNARVNNTL